MFYSKALSVGLAVIISAGFASYSYAVPLGGLTKDLGRNRAIQLIAVSRPTLAPYAHVRFCVQNPDDCQAGNRGNDIVDLTPAKKLELQRINRVTNRSIRPQSDEAGNDEWKIGGAAGDCEDFALTKRRHLIDAGWPAQALRLVVARTFDGEGHAVLAVATSDGDLILDNRTNTIKEWRKTDLRLLKIQSGENPRQWYDIGRK
ncbi:transglutaminase-like cysteine peptidase [Rhizobium cremeum]|uniref:transglutaminase-like cysteine peptidase n=1 Tax=Rhizobium cremeum TaxID=2813827 RepID=UPI000DD7D7E2|nr:transglutaminase-like cysteine peptidase [Rhizobium cremeum]MCJ7997843.1 transglutaminase-like cysteine peptidase [Rhizobium cremeum]MCJ8001972.1 transglutaminase-like cysteine peptidase [Rhizobium cremeum]MCJ8002919.1 transglutaminase-like cysteine peptidase [Rhizobium cremeum]